MTFLNGILAENITFISLQIRMLFYLRSEVSGVIDDHRQKFHHRVAFMREATHFSSKRLYQK